MSSLITLLVFSAFVIYGNFQPLGQSIYNGCSYAVKTSGYLISSTAKLTAGMQNGKYNLNCRNSCFVVDTYRNSPTIIYNCNGVVWVDAYLDLCTISCQSFIYRIIYNFVYKMMQTPAGCTSNIHTRSFTNRFQPFQNLNLVRSVLRIFSAHVLPPVIQCYIKITGCISSVGHTYTNLL